MNLVELPHENLFQIATYLEFEDIKNLTQTCRDINSVCNDQHIWKIYSYRDFISAGKIRDELDWKQTYLLLHTHPLMSSEIFNTLHETIVKYVPEPIFIDILTFKTSKFPFYDEYGDVFILASEPHKQWLSLTDDLRSGNISAHSFNVYDIDNKCKIYIVHINGIVEQGIWMPENLYSEYD